MKLYTKKAYNFGITSSVSILKLYYLYESTYPVSIDASQPPSLIISCLIDMHIAQKSQKTLTIQYCTSIYTLSVCLLVYCFQSRKDEFEFLLNLFGIYRPSNKILLNSIWWICWFSGQGGDTYDIVDQVYEFQKRKPKLLLDDIFKINWIYVALKQLQVLKWS